MCSWKTVRSRPKVAANTEAAIADATGRALAADDEATRIGALLELEGVGVPTASTLLYFAFPDDYPILDIRALESLGVKPRSTARRVDVDGDAAGAIRIRASVPIPLDLGALGRTPTTVAT